MRTRALLVLLGVLWAVPASAAITVTEKAALETSDNLTTYDTTTGTWVANGGATTFTLATNTLGLCFFVHSDADAPETIASVTQTGQTWVEVAASVAFDTVATPLKRVSAWRTLGAGAAAAGLSIAITGGTDQQTGMIVMCYEVAGVDTSGTNGSGAILQTKTGAADAVTAHTVTLDAARTANSALFHAYGSDAGGVATAEAGYTAGTRNDYATPSTIGQTQWVVGGTDTTPTWTTAATNGASFAVEVKEAAAGSGTSPGALLRGVG